MHGLVRHCASGASHVSTHGNLAGGGPRKLRASSALAPAPQGAAHSHHQLVQMRTASLGSAAEGCRVSIRNEV